MLRRITLVLVAVVLTSLSLAGCGADDDKKAPAKKRNILLERLTEARADIDAAETVTIALKAKGLPDGTSGLQAAKGSGNKTPAFTGTVKYITGSSTLSAEIIAVGAEVVAKPSFSPVFITIDPASMKAPNPASFFEKDTGVSQILVETKSLTEVGKSRDGEDVLTAITGTLPGAVVRAIIPSADTTAPFDVTYRLTDDNELRDATITGPFYPNVDDVTYTITTSTSDEPVVIKLPE
ncbi:MAG TPA: LppX_LprAFG lipoprotein [Aeromicrobium sp.]|nr:LppX_LprAFG lipoprotein [Aeromicrobium sp.]